MVTATLSPLQKLWCPGDLMQGSALSSLPKSLSSEEALGPLSSQVPLSPTKVQGPTQEKNVYSKADSSKGVGAGTLMALHVAFFSKALPQGKAIHLPAMGGMPASSSS